jgi:hypothetical protein
VRHLRVHRAFGGGEHALELAHQVLHGRGVGRRAAEQRGGIQSLGAHLGEDLVGPVAEDAVQGVAHATVTLVGVVGQVAHGRSSTPSGAAPAPRTR